MSKREELLRSGGSNILSSMGAGQSQELPAGLDPAAALRRPAHLEGLTREKAAARIAVDRIVRDPDQPREEFDEEALQRLADSLRTRGQLQPILVRWDEGRGVYVILVGERRWRAAQRAGLAELSCIVVEGELPADERLMIQLVENALREDLRPVEQARAYKALMEARGWSGNQLAKELHIAQSSVVRALALLELPAPVQAQVEQGALAATVAAELTKLPESAMQAEVAQAIVDQGLTRSEVAEVVKAVRARRPAQTRPDPVEVDLGDGITVVVRYRNPTTVTAQQALRKALKVLQDRDRDDQAA
ncbi:MAG TPA: ParB/RepB/Spo0J family partition protein [Isosphaeraceae bacterium]|nr:ParB/RepB/Spo0J family partition protein [Isosphaeraceae bacterium]